MDNEDRIVFTNMLRHLRESNFLLVKLIDEFVDLSAPHQDAFVSFFHEKVGDERWNACASDRLLYKEFMKALVMHYSGSDLRNEPCPKDFAIDISEYLKSDKCMNANRMPKKTFSEILETMHE